MRKIASLIAVIVTLNSQWVMAEEDCTSNLAYAGLYYAVQINHEQDAGKVFKEKVDALEKLGNNKAFKHFKIVSQDLNIEQENYLGGNNVTLSFSFSLQYDGDYDAITVLQKESGARSVSLSKSNC